MSCNILSFGWLFALRFHNFRKMRNLNNVKPQDFRTGKSSGLRPARSSDLVKVFIDWFGSKVIAEPTQLWEKHEFCRSKPDRETIVLKK